MATLMVLPVLVLVMFVFGVLGDRRTRRRGDANVPDGGAGPRHRSSDSVAIARQPAHTARVTARQRLRSSR
ncbi:hypothetical protein SRB17_39350 [Streptomyces sp. RB17]|nr:hypothetical protein [Streptomyces sp. RB17]